MQKHRRRRPEASWERALRVKIAGEAVLGLAVACGGSYRSSRLSAKALEEGPDVLGVYVFPTKVQARDFYRRVKATQRSYYLAEVRENDPKNTVVVREI